MAEAEEMVREFMRVLSEATEAAKRSVLDGTVSCQVCRALVLESNAPDHYRWHYNGHKVDYKVCRMVMEA